MDVLKEKTYKSYNRLSRYVSFPYYYNTNDNKWMYGTTAYLDDSISYQTHIIKQNETYDLLALKYYNNPTYFWIICSFNHIQDPFELPVEGTKIKIPSLSSLKYT